MKHGDLLTIHNDRKNLVYRSIDTVLFLWLLLLSTICRGLALLAGLSATASMRLDLAIASIPQGDVGWSRLSNDDGLYHWRRPKNPTMSDEEMSIITKGK